MESHAIGHHRHARGAARRLDPVTNPAPAPIPMPRKTAAPAARRRRKSSPAGETQTPPTAIVDKPFMPGVEQGPTFVLSEALLARFIPVAGVNLADYLGRRVTTLTPARTILGAPPTASNTVTPTAAARPRRSRGFKRRGASP